MKFEQTSKKDLLHSYEITVSKEEFNTEKKTKISEVAKGAKIQGFRPGKAPESIIEANYKNKILTETIDSCVNKAVDELYKKEKLNPVAAPKISIKEFKNEGDLIISLEVENSPEISEIDFSKHKIDKTVVEISDEEVQKSLTEISNHYKSTKDVKRKAKMGDTVVIDFLGKLDGEPFDGGAAKDFALELGSKMFIPGFEEQLVGLSASDSKVVEVSFPDDYHVENLKGKPVTFDVDIKVVQESVSPEIDDELAKKVNMDNLDALKEDIRKRYSEQVEIVEKASLKKQIVEIIGKEADFTVPNTLLEAELKVLNDERAKILEHLKDTKEEDLARMFSEESIKNAKVTEKTAKKRYEEKASKNIRLGLYLHHVAKENKLSVSNEDLQKAITQEAAMYGGGNPQQFLEYYSQNKEALKGLQDRVLEDKIMSILIEKVGFKEKKVSFEEYTNSFSQ